MVPRAVEIARALKERAISVAGDNAAISHERQLIGGARFIDEPGVLKQKRLMQGVKAAEGFAVFRRQRFQRGFRPLFTGDRPGIENDHRRGEIFNLRIRGERRPRAEIVFVFQGVRRLDQARQIVIFHVVIGENFRRKRRRRVNIA